MKRYIKATVQTLPTLEGWINEHGSPYDVINLEVDGRHLHILRHEEGLSCYQWRYYLKNPDACPELYRLGDYLVSDGMASPFEDVYQYTLYIVSPH